MAGPLDGVRILDFGTAGVGPWAATLLGSLGADVIKVERPAGDRHLDQSPFQRRVATAYTFCNMNKRGIIADLKEPRTSDKVKQLVRQADVLMENLRPSSLEKLAFGYDAVNEINPHVVYASSPAWGFEGPMRDIPATDPFVQLYSGFASYNGAPGEEPEMLRYPLLDLTASCFFASSVLLGLLARQRTGASQRIRCSHFRSSLVLQASRIAELFATGRPPVPMGSACVSTVPNQAFRCEDQRYIAIAAVTDEQWVGLCRALGSEELAGEPRFTTNRQRVQNRDELVPLLEDVLRTKPARWWDLQLSKEGVPHSLFCDFETLRHHVQVVENNYLGEVDIPHQGPMLVGCIPWHFSRTPARVFAAPLPGQHTEDVLAHGFGGPARTSPRPALASPAANVSGAPLSGVRVVDVTQGLCGPFLTLLLADAGATVVKVEPPSGDYARAFAPAYGGSDSAAFVLFNRNKQSLALDFTTDDGRRILKGLLRDADVFVEDWGTGKAAGFGLDYESLKRLNPRLVCCALSGFGERGPLSAQPGEELVAQAASESWASLGVIGGPPERIGADAASVGTAAMACIGLLGALLERETSGEGQRVAVSMFGAMLCLRVGLWSAISDPDEWHGSYCDSYTIQRRRGYRAKDRPIYFGLHNSSEEAYCHLLAELDMLDVLVDPRFGDGGRDAVGQGRYARHVVSVWEKHFASRTASELMEIVKRHQGAAVQFNDLAEAIGNPQVDAMGLVKVVDLPGTGQLRVLGPPWSGTWEELPVSPPPSIGQHSVPVLRSWGFSEEEIAAGLQKGVVGTPKAQAMVPS